MAKIFNAALIALNEAGNSKLREADEALQNVRDWLQKEVVEAQAKLAALHPPGTKRKNRTNEAVVPGSPAEKVGNPIF
jgi:hypothetical protein